MGGGAHAFRRRLAASGLCLILLIFGALACGDDPVAPEEPAPAAILPDGAQNLCQYWRRADGSCDEMALVADYEECVRTAGAPERERLRRSGRINRLVHKGTDRKTNTCLELRSWVITDEGRRDFLRRFDWKTAPK